MIFHPTDVEGVYVIEPERYEDSRGSFYRTWCREEMARMGLETRLDQSSASINRAKGTLRGMHFQRAPKEEAKVVRCVQGAIYDVALDLRPESRTYRQWAAVELNSRSGLQLYIPKGCAHGFQTLTEDTEVLYQIATPYSALHSAGVRWNDPAFRIEWPLADPILSERDAKYSDYLMEAIAA
jgi:dTDP-4-dehydrorhamnose 3,5-epimerase